MPEMVHKVRFRGHVWVSPADRSGEPPNGRELPLASVKPRDASPVWKRRLTWVTTPPGSDRIGTIIAGERLPPKVGCPRCRAPGVATVWRRFDYAGRDHPVYFTKCRRCRHRAAAAPLDVAMLLLDAGVDYPLELIPEAGHSMWADDPSHDRTAIVSVASAERLLLNYERAFGKKHLLTHTARSILADAVGDSGDPTEAVRMYQGLLLDQQRELRSDHPAVLANRYREAQWTAKDGHPSPALVAFSNLLVDQERTAGPEHPNALVIRASIGKLRAATGEVDEAVALLRQVQADQTRILGSEHPSTESTRRALSELDDH